LLDKRGILQTMSAPIGAKATAEMLRQLHGEDSRFELIHGEISEKAMSRREHASAQATLLVPVSRRFDRKPGGKWPGGWKFMSELHVQYRDDEVFCHDLCGFRRELHPEFKKEWPCTARPDWVCELLSPGHHKRDRVDKSAVLFRSKVPHYWIVDPEEKLLEIYRWTPDGYTLARTAGPGETVRAEPFDAVELRTSVLFGDEDDDE
jgi:Uma2 family endonuclease